MINKIINFQFSVFNITIAPKKMLKHPLIKGSLVMVIGTNLGNFIAYIYHLIMGRLMGPVYYGELAAIIATLGLFSTAFTFFGLVIVKFVSSSKESDIGGIYNWFFSNGKKIGMVLFLVSVITSPVLAKFIHIDLKVVVLLAPILMFILLGFLVRSFLQGLLRFWQIVVIQNIDLIGRLIFGALFFYLGLKTFGAVLGLMLSVTISYLIGKNFLNDIKLSGSNKYYEKSREIVKYALPVLVISIANNSFMTTDIILVKHYFSSFDAGLYAALSTLGKVIFYGSGPIGAVMFPIISKRYSQGKSFLAPFLLSITAIFGLGLTVLGIYFLAPGLMVNILYGEKFISASANLAMFGVFALLLTLSNTIVAFYLSIERTKIWVIPSVFAIFQIFLILFFHHNLLQVVGVSIFAATLFLITLSVYFGYDYKKLKSVKIK